MLSNLFNVITHIIIYYNFHCVTSLRFGIECGLVVFHCLVRIVFEICAGALVLSTGPLAAIVATFTADFVPRRRTAARFIFLRL